MCGSVQDRGRDLGLAAGCVGYTLCAVPVPARQPNSKRTTVQSRMAFAASRTGVWLTGLGCVLRLARRSAPGVKGLLII